MDYLGDIFPLQNAICNLFTVGIEKRNDRLIYKQVAGNQPFPIILGGFFCVLIFPALQIGSGNISVLFSSESQCWAAVAQHLGLWVTVQKIVLCMWQIKASTVWSGSVACCLITYCMQIWSLMEFVHVNILFMLTMLKMQSWGLLHYYYCTGIIQYIIN